MFKSWGLTTTKMILGKTNRSRDHSQGNQKQFTSLFHGKKTGINKKATAQVATQFVRDLGGNIYGFENFVMLIVCTHP